LKSIRTKATPVEEAGSTAAIRTTIGCGLVVVLLVLVYANALDNDFHYDDFHSIVDNRHVRSLANIPQFFTDPQTFSMLTQRAMFRPLVLTSYAVNFHFGQYRTYGYRVLNLGVHAVCALLVFALARSLGLKPLWSGFASLAFAFHPVQAETVNYISSRSESLAAMGYLLALVAFLQLRGRSVGGKRSGWWPYALVLVGLVIGLLAKSIVVTLPLAVLFLDWWRRNRKRHVSSEAGWKPELIRVHLSLWIVAALYVVIVKEFAATALSTPVRSLDVQLLTQAKALVYYAMLAVMPVKLSIDHQFLASEAVPSVAVVVSALFVASSVALLVRRATGVMRTLLLPAVWSGLVLLPTVIVPLNVLVNEHRLYLPLAFGAIALAALMPVGEKGGAAVNRFRLLPVVLGVCLLAYALTTHQRNQAWRDGFTIWSDAISKGPLMFRAHQELGGVYESRDDFAAALGRYETAATLAPQVPEVHYNKGNALRGLGRLPEAELAYRMSIETSSETFVPALVNLGLLLRPQQPDESMTLIERASTLEPGNPDAWLALGLVHKDRDDLQAAESAFEKALGIAPASSVIHYSLGNLYLDDGRLEAAVNRYQDAISLNEASHDARYNLALTYLRLGRYRDALALSTSGLKRWPEGVKLHYALARAQEGLGMKVAAVESYRRFLPHAPSKELRTSISKRMTTLQSTMTPE